MSNVAPSTYVGRVWGASLTDKVHYKTHHEREGDPMTYRHTDEDGNTFLVLEGDGMVMPSPTPYRLDRWQQDLADELARLDAERPPVTVADLRRMMGLPPTGDTP